MTLSYKYDWLFVKCVFRTYIMLLEFLRFALYTSFVIRGLQSTYNEPISISGKLLLYNFRKYRMENTVSNNSSIVASYVSYREDMLPHNISVIMCLTSRCLVTAAIFSHPVIIRTHKFQSHRQWTEYFVGWMLNGNSSYNNKCSRGIYILEPTLADREEYVVTFSKTIGRREL